MSMPASNSAGPVAEFIARHETLKALMEWFTDRFGEPPHLDDTIEWEDGEEHDEPKGPTTL